MSKTQSQGRMVINTHGKKGFAFHEIEYNKTDETIALILYFR